MTKKIFMLVLGVLTMTKAYSTHNDELLLKAQEAMSRAYAPYSTYCVGAALLTKEGEIIQGCNVENASYGLTLCAERAAVMNAISQGFREFSAIAIVTRDGGTPCGACRQVLNEFNPHMLIITLDETGHVTFEGPLHVLLPEAFGPHNLD